LNPFTYALWEQKPGKTPSIAEATRRAGRVSAAAFFLPMPFTLFSFFAVTLETHFTTEEM